MSVIGHITNWKSEINHSKDLYGWELLYNVSRVERDSIFFLQKKFHCEKDM